MKFSCAKAQLERAVGIAERFCGKNLALPILANILMEAGDNSVVVTATNLEQAVQFRVPARIAKPGKVCVPAKVFSSLLQSLGEDKLDAEAERGNLHLRTESRESRLNGSSADDFPLVPKIKKSAAFTVETAALTTALSRVLPAVSSSEFKPELAGALFRSGRDTLTLCATDTFRLAEHQVPLAKSEESGSTSFIVPHRAVQEMARILEGEDGVTSLVLGDNQILVESVGGGRMISRLVEGNFPDYQGIIPSHFTTSAYLPRGEIMSGVRASSIFASKLQEVTLRLGTKQIEVAAANPEVGEYHTRHNAALNGKEIAMSFNWRYLLDGIQALEDDEVFFGCNQETSPALLRNKSRADFTYVVMPIRLT